jgi:hypothetical protein
MDTDDRSSGFVALRRGEARKGVDSVHPLINGEFGWLLECFCGSTLDPVAA